MRRKLSVWLLYTSGTFLICNSIASRGSLVRRNSSAILRKSLWRHCLWRLIVYLRRRWQHFWLAVSAWSTTSWNAWIARVRRFDVTATVKLFVRRAEGVKARAAGWNLGRVHCPCEVRRDGNQQFDFILNFAIASEQGPEKR